MNESKEKRGVGKPLIDLKERVESIRLEDDFYTIEELAKILKVHPNTIRNNIKKGKIIAKKYGEQWRIRKSDIQWKEGSIKYEIRNKKWNNGSIERK